MTATQTIPLVSLTAFTGGRPFSEDTFNKSNWPRIEITACVENGYGVRIDERTAASNLKPGAIAVFSTSERESPKSIFCLGRKNAEPLLCRFVKSETPPDTSEGGGSGSAQDRPFDWAQDRRKRFMTPTPLHIPGSRQSPIADSIHRRLYFIPLGDPENMILVHPDHIVWMHPLVYIHDEET